MACNRKCGQDWLSCLHCQCSKKHEEVEDECCTRKARLKDKGRCGKCPPSYTDKPCKPCQQKPASSGGTCIRPDCGEKATECRHCQCTKIHIPRADGCCNSKMQRPNGRCKNCPEPEQGQCRGQMVEPSSPGEDHDHEITSSASSSRGGHIHKEVIRQLEKEVGRLHPLERAAARDHEAFRGTRVPNIQSNGSAASGGAQKQDGSSRTSAQAKGRHKAAPPPEAAAGSSKRRRLGLRNKVDQTLEDSTVPLGAIRQTASWATTQPATIGTHEIQRQARGHEARKQSAKRKRSASCERSEASSSSGGNAASGRAQGTPQSSEAPSSSGGNAASGQAQDKPPSSEAPSSSGGNAASGRAQGTPQSSEAPSSSGGNAASGQAQDKPPFSGSPSSFGGYAASGQPQGKSHSSEAPSSSTGNAASGQAQGKPQSSEAPSGSGGNAASGQAQGKLQSSEAPSSSGGNAASGQGSRSKDKPQSQLREGHSSRGTQHTVHLGLAAKTRATDVWEVWEVMAETSRIQQYIGAESYLSLLLTCKKFARIFAFKKYEKSYEQLATDRDGNIDGASDILGLRLESEGDESKAILRQTTGLWRLKCSTIGLYEVLSSLEGIVHLTVEYGCLGPVEGNVPYTVPCLGNLRSLRLTSFYSGLGDASFSFLSSFISGSPRLRHIQLQGYGMNEECDVALLFGTLKTLSGLRSLILVNGSFDDHGTMKLVDCLSSLPDLTELNLRGGYINDRQMKVLMRGVRGLQFLKSFDIGNNQLTLDGVTELASLGTCLTALTCLRIDSVSGRRVRLGDHGLNALCPIIKHGKELQTIDLRQWDMTDVGVKSFVEHLPLNSRLTEILLPENRVGLGGLRNIANNLHRLKCLTTIDLSGNYIGNAGLRELGEKLSDVSNLQILKLNGIVNGDDGLGATWAVKESLEADALTAMMPNIGRLKTLSLSRNWIHDDALCAISRGLSLGNARLLQELDLSYNTITMDGMKKLEASCKLCTELRVVHLSENPLREYGYKFFKNHCNKIRVL